MLAIDLLAWTQTMLLHDGDLAKAEPKKLRYRLLHVAARITRVRPPDPAAHRRTLALGVQPRHRVHPPRRPAPTSVLNIDQSPCDHTPRNPATASDDQPWAGNHIHPREINYASRQP